MAAVHRRVPQSTKKLMLAAAMIAVAAHESDPTSADAEPDLGWTLGGENGDVCDGDCELDDVDAEAEPDMCQADDPVFPTRSVLAPNPEPCCPGPFQLVGREWNNGRFPE